MNVCLAVSIMIFLTQTAYGSYDCLCSYTEETSVFPSPDTTHIPLGYMYEFDCKPFSTPIRNENGYFIIQYEHKTGYVAVGDPHKLQEQTCAGSIPDMDAVTPAHSPEPITSNYSHLNTATAVIKMNTTTTSSGYIINSTSTIPPDHVEVSTIQMTNSTYLSTSGSSVAPLANTTVATKVTTTLSNTGTVITHPDEIITTHKTSNATRTTGLSPSQHANVTDISLYSSTIIHPPDDASTTDMASSKPLVMIESSQSPSVNITSQLPLKMSTKKDVTNAVLLTIESSLLGIANTTESTKGVGMASTAINRSMNPSNPTSIINTAPGFPPTNTSTLNSIISTSSRTISSTTAPLLSTSSFTETKSNAILNMNVTANFTGGLKVTSIFDNSTFSESPTTTAWSYTSTETTKPKTNYFTSPLITSILTTSSSLPSTTVAMSSPTTTPSTMPTTQTSVQTTPAPITWPSGTYGLVEAAQGCPNDGHVTWSEGWRYQDTEGALIGSGNTYTWGIGNYMKGVFTRNNIKTYFCMKTHHVPSPYDHDWPAGSYCILKYGHCPKGFRSGSIFWDDVVIGNNDDKGGTLPDGNFGTETEIFYCCRGDGPVSTGIVLPPTKPFILLRYTKTCQTVKGMSAYDISIYWDDQNLFNSDHSTGMHPYDDGDRRNHRLHFCYYSPMSGTGGGPGLVG